MLQNSSAEIKGLIFPFLQDFKHIIQPLYSLCSRPPSLRQIETFQWEETGAETSKWNLHSQTNSKGSTCHHKMEHRMQRTFPPPLQLSAQHSPNPKCKQLESARPDNSWSLPKECPAPEPGQTQSKQHLPVPTGSKHQQWTACDWTPKSDCLHSGVSKFRKLRCDTYFWVFWFSVRKAVMGEWQKQFTVFFCSRVTGSRTSWVFPSVRTDPVPSLK